MKKMLFISFLFFLCGGFAFSQTEDFPDLIFSDEFDGTAVNTNVWSYQTGTGQDGWGNQELQYYRGENATVKDGHLVITGKRESYGGRNYTSTRMRTNGKFFTTYGRIEARISLPIEEGLWPAFWMMPERSVYGGWAASGEIDIMEAKGRLPRLYGGAIHFGGGWPNNTYLTSGDYTFPNNKTIEDFHVYAVEWKEGEIAWYCDNVLVRRRTSGWYSSAAAFPAPFDQDFHIILNLAIGGHFDNYVQPSSDWRSGEMKVDYVRVYKWKGTGQTAGTNAAFGKPVTASSQFNHPENGLLAAKNVTDGSISTRWGSNEEDIEFKNEWIKVDLEAVETIEKVVIKWEGAYAKSFDVQISTNNNTWETIYTTTSGTGNTTTITPTSPVSARYIQVNCNQKISPWEGHFYGYSILELEAYKPSSTGNDYVSSKDNVRITKDANEIRINSESGIKKACLYSAGGQLIAMQTQPILNISGLTTGLYVLVVQDENNSVTKFKVIL